MLLTELLCVTRFASILFFLTLDALSAAVVPILTLASIKQQPVKSNGAAITKTPVTIAAYVVAPMAR